MRTSTWIGSQNRYANNTISTISDELAAGAIVSPGELSEYIAASCLLHCADGWSYLGRAISSLLRGDPHRARHLAYYAELRGAAALLATEGIGVFREEHFAITAPDRASGLITRKGTHVFAWDCLDFWAALPSSAALFSEIIRPHGLDLEKWCESLGGASVLAPHAREWFKQWGMDLRIFPDDHRARNVSSYQPDGLPRIWALDSHAVINFVKGLWQALEPSPVCRFDTLDRHILRISLERYFVGRYGKSAAKARPEIKAFVKPIVESHGLSEEFNKQWLGFMCREIDGADLDIFKFSQKLPDDMDVSTFAVMSRATLLLRAASGSTAALFHAANHSIGSHKFWWHKFGNARGLWHGNREGDTLSDLWVDTGTPLPISRIFRVRNPGMSRHTFVWARIFQRYSQLLAVANVLRYGQCPLEVVFLL